MAVFCGSWRAFSEGFSVWIWTEGRRLWRQLLAAPIDEKDGGASLGRRPSLGKGGTSIEQRAKGDAARVRPALRRSSSQSCDQAHRDCPEIGGHAAIGNCGSG